MNAAKTVGGGALLCMTLAIAAHADFRVAPVSDPLVIKECKACHMVYPAGLMEAESWRRIVLGLKDHFGDNAEVDEATAEKLTAYLTANAARPRRGQAAASPSSAPLRITELAWFKRKHTKRDRIAPATLARRGAKSASDCIACHKRGEAGDFDD